MTATAKTPPATIPRPLSPHLQVYRPQLTSGMSIFHRITGIVLAFGLLPVVAWLLVLAGPPAIYPQFMGLFDNWFGQLVILGFGFAYFYHFFCGIRHLFWDAGYFLSIKAVYVTGYCTIVAAFALTALMALKIYGVLP